MKPYVICHMMSTIDGRIDGEALRSLGDFNEKTNRPAGPQPVHVARRSSSYAISVDTTGKLKWSSSDLEGDHIICIVSERAADDYLAMLRDAGVSYIVAGSQEVDLAKALEALYEHFGIRKLLLEGGGHINGGFVKAELLDEVSLLIAPGIDGRRGLPTVFDGMAASQQNAVPLRIKTVEHRGHDVLWIRYEVIR